MRSRDAIALGEKRRADELEIIAAAMSDLTSMRIVENKKQYPTAVISAEIKRNCFLFFAKLNHDVGHAGEGVKGRRLGDTTHALRNSTRAEGW